MQGLVRMEELRQLTSLRYDKVMIFPHEISPKNTLSVLKEYNYLCTVNTGNVPFNSKPSLRFDFNMKPANMDYESFPSLDRIHVSSDLSVFSLFIDKPVILFGHVYGSVNIFKNGIGSFDNTAHNINQLETQVEWRSLGYIANNLHLEKINTDGTVSVNMFSNRLNLKNKYEVPKTFHIQKRETSNVTISEVLVDEKKVQYYIDNNYLKLTLFLPPLHTARINVKYSGIIPESISSGNNDLEIWLLRHGSEFRDKFLSAHRLSMPLVLLWENFGFRAFMLISLSFLVIFAASMFILLFLVIRIIKNHSKV
jgi:hypothetical protein